MYKYLWLGKTAWSAREVTRADLINLLKLNSEHEENVEPFVSVLENHANRDGIITISVGMENHNTVLTIALI